MEKLHENFQHMENNKGPDLSVGEGMTSMSGRFALILAPKLFGPQMAWRCHRHPGIKRLALC